MIQNHALFRVEIPPKPFAALKPARRSLTIGESVKVEIPPKPFAALKHIGRPEANEEQTR